VYFCNAFLKIKMKNITLALIFACQIGIAQVDSKPDSTLNSTENSVSEIKSKSIPSKVVRQVIIKKEKTSEPVKKAKIVTSKPIIHVIAEKETLYTLLKKYKTSEADFLKANPGFDKTMPMKIGQKLSFISTSDPKPIITQKNTPLDNKIALNKKSEINPKPIAVEKSVNDKTKTALATQKPNAADKKIVDAKLADPKVKVSDKIVGNQTKPQIKNAADYHIVQAHETIFALAKKYELDITEFVEANDLTDNVIKPGQKLLINKLEMKKAKAIFDKKNEPVYVQKPTGKKSTGC
jgi:LysM repeat protein